MDGVYAVTVQSHSFAGHSLLLLACSESSPAIASSTTWDLSASAGSRTAQRLSRSSLRSPRPFVSTLWTSVELRSSPGTRRAPLAGSLSTTCWTHLSRSGPEEGAQGGWGAASCVCLPVCVKTRFLYSHRGVKCLFRVMVIQTNVACCCELYLLLYRCD